MKCTLFLGSLLGLLLSDGAAAIHKSSIITRHPHSGRKNVNQITNALPSSSTSPFRVDGIGNHPLIADHSTPALLAKVCRGGACSDSTPALFAKVALAAAVETGLMYGLLSYAVKANTMDYSTAITRYLQAAILLAIIFGSASFGAIIDNGLSAATKQLFEPNTIPGDGDWYANLRKPSWNPPGWIFPIMWLIVSKPTQFMAVWKLITQSYEKDLSLPLLAYCFHLSLGDAWNKVFFGLECTGRGLAVIGTFWSVLWLSAYLFYRVDPNAGLLLLPTCLWVTVASALNWSIYLLNKGTSEAS